MSKLLYTSSEWTLDAIDRTWQAIDNIGKNVLGLDYYKPSLEIISYEQMLDAYSTVAMPIMYNHWSFGKSFVKNSSAYQKGQMGLAYEVVINTDPCIAYLMENNSMTMQTLVMSHAVCGHGSFFKNNYLFKEWTDADGILNYLKFAKNYIKQCEDRYGVNRVESLLDAAHALQLYGVDKYKRPMKRPDSFLDEQKRLWREYQEQLEDDLWKTVPNDTFRRKNKIIDHTVKTLNQDRDLPEENVLYFIEKNSPVLNSWEKEIIRIVRKIAQYFYPQQQTQVMNEGWACFVHYHVLLELHAQGLITDGAYLEFLSSHTAVVKQPGPDSPYYSGINPYALGFSMMMDIKRICTEPTKEDLEWFPDIANTDHLETMRNIIANYRDESFILQFLSPKLIRDMGFFSFLSDEEAASHVVSEVSDDEGYYNIREHLAKQYNLSYRLPQIEVARVNWSTDRMLTLNYNVNQNQRLIKEDAEKTLAYIDKLWGFKVYLNTKD